MNMTDQLAAEFATLETRKVVLSDRAIDLLRTLNYRNRMSFPDLIETALQGYERAWKESE